MSIELESGYHVNHSEYGFCEVRSTHREDSSKTYIKRLGESVDRLERIQIVDFSDLELVDVDGYRGDHPFSKHDYVTLEDDGGLWKLTGFVNDDETVFKANVKHVEGGNRTVEIGQLRNPSDVLREYGFCRNEDGDVTLDWREVDIKRLLNRDDVRPALSLRSHEISRSVSDFWANMNKLAGEDARLTLCFNEYLEVFICEDSDTHVSDDSFGYEYGSISGTHECYSAYIEFGEAEIDVLALREPDLFESDEKVLTFDHDGVSFEIELDVSDLSVEEVDLGGYTFYHVTGEVVQIG